MSEALRMNSVGKRYGSSVGLADVRFSLPAGRIVGLLGPNGSGKTTLLKVAAGLILDYQGEVTVAGYKPGRESKALTSYLPDADYLPDWMKPSDAIALFMDMYHDFDPARARDMMRRFGVGDAKRMKQMSKGMREKVQIILVMSRKAKVYLLDEPLGGIDPSARAAMLEIILQNYDQQALVLLSTHLIHDVERIFDSVLMLKEGRIVCDMEVDALRETTGHSLEEHFLEVFSCSAN